MSERREAGPVVEPRAAYEVQMDMHAWRGAAGPDAETAQAILVLLTPEEKGLADEPPSICLNARWGFAIAGGDALPRQAWELSICGRRARGPAVGKPQKT
jgi:hypothetical protein